MKFNTLSRSLLCAAMGISMTASLNAAEEYQVNRGVEYLGDPVTPAKVTVDMTTLPKVKAWKPGDPIKEIPMRSKRPKDWVRPEAAERGYGFDPLAAKQLEAAAANRGVPSFDTPIVNAAGIPFTGANPADTNGDVGIDYYVQSTNGGGTTIRILNKADGTVASQFNLDDLAIGSGTGCTSGRGDPIILFDQFAANGPGEPNGKWVLTEFTNSSFCVYISQTTDPTAGTWFIYEFISATGTLPDYPKFGVWPDAYYIGANEDNRQYALDRENMIIGATTRPYQVVQSPNLPGFGFQHMMPADADGVEPPPAGSPGIFMRHRDGEYHDGPDTPDVLELWEFSIDWDTPANTTMSGPVNIEMEEFDTNLGGTNFGDLSVPQPDGATNLFPLKQPLMWRVQYRIVNGEQKLVGNMVTDVDGNDYHGVRWWQLSRPGGVATGGWVKADEGTYTLNDGVHRWMASTAMDVSGNIAIGYNTSGIEDADGNPAPVYAGMRYAGRLVSDPAGTMPQGEGFIIEGSASNGSGRYGDYTSLSVDPVDECTFWYTAQYNPATTWGTQVASFRFEQCGCELDLDLITVNSASATADNVIQIEWEDSNNEEITEYRVYRATSSGGSYSLIDTVTDTSPGVGNDGTYTYDDTTVSGGTEYFYVVRAGDGETCLTDSSTEVSATATGECTLTPVYSGIESAINNATATCGIDLGWSAAASQCPNGAGEITYSVYRSETADFTPDPSNLIASELTGLSYSDVDEDLVSDTDYFYIVRATDLDNDLQDENTVEATAFPTGPISPEVFDENLDAYADLAQAQADGGWSVVTNVGTNDWRIESGDDNTTGTGNAFVSTDVPELSDKSIVTRSFSPSATTVLSFFHKYDFEPTYDGGVLEITTDEGTTWQDLGSFITVGPYDLTLNGGFGQPLGAVPAWNGLVADFTEVNVDLSSFEAQIVQVRWRMGTDSSVSAGDWKVDDIVITDSGSFGVCMMAVDPDIIFADGFE